MSQEHDKSHSDQVIAEGIHPETAPFEPGYQPETLPKISVPDLADDALGLSAEALAQVPTLTECVDDTPAEAPAETQAAAAAVVHPELDLAAPAQADIQEMPPQADIWHETLHVRMGKLTDDIHTLNTRLDRLEERNRTKA
jgi:hypothetical protein